LGGRFGVKKRPALLVEDEPTARHIARLLPRDMAVLRVHRKSDALSELRRHDRFALIIINAVLAGDAQAGLDVLDIAATMHPATPIALMTTTPQSATVNRAARHGAYFLWKPFTRDHLTAIIERSHRAHLESSVRLSNLVAVRSRAWRLSSAEAGWLSALLVGGESESLVEGQSGESSTSGALTAQLLSKSGFASTHELVLTLLRDAVRD
jgi:FixJ family two-component response regulator